MTLPNASFSDFDHFIQRIPSSGWAADLIGFGMFIAGAGLLCLGAIGGVLVLVEWIKSKGNDK